MKKRKLWRRNPIVRAVRHIRPKMVPSAKVYSRRLKHKGHSDINRNDLFLFCVSGFERLGKATPPPAAACR